MVQTINNDVKSINIGHNSAELLIKHGIDIKQFTHAPLRMTGEFDFNCSPEALWPLVTEAEKIALWFPIIFGGKFNHSTSAAKGNCGAGSVRVCRSAMGAIHERFLYWDKYNCYIYSARSIMMPINNHAAVVILESIGTGKTKLSWLMYFNYKGLFMRHLFPMMMPALFNIGIKKLARLIGGGKGGTMHSVR